MSFVKIAAVTAVAACTGGGIIIGSGTSSSASPAPVVLDHYLCSRHFGSPSCDPVQVVLPDTTTFGVNDPDGHLVCREAWHRRHGNDGGPTNALIANEFSTAPIPLVVGRLRSTCSVVHPNTSSAIHAHAATLAGFSCYSVFYPSADGAHFTPPFPVTANGITLRIFGPSRLCVSTDPAAATAPNGDLLCFNAEVVDATSHHHHFFRRFAQLCVPSTDPVETAPGSTTTSGATTTTSTAPIVTTTTAAPTTTTLGTTTSSQPCAGRIQNGICIIDG